MVKANKKSGDIMKQTDIVKMALLAGFDEWESYCLPGKSNTDRLLAVSKYPVGEAVMKFAELLTLAIMEEWTRFNGIGSRRRNKEEKMNDNFLKVGDVIELNGHEVFAEVPKHFIYDNKKGDFLCVRTNIKISGIFSYLAGKYIVIKTVMNGGIKDSPYGRNDYADGYHVYAVKENEQSIIVDFYQSGDFHACNPDIKSIGKAKQIWVIENE